MLQSDPGARYVLLETRQIKGNHFDDKQRALEHYFDKHGLKAGERIDIQDKTPDFKAMYPEDEIAQRGVAVIWPHLTLEQKEMTPPSLEKLMRSWHLLKPEQWKTLSESEIFEFISASDKFSIEAQTIYETPDLRKYLASIDEPNEQSIEAWMTMPAKFKRLPPSDLSDIIDLGVETDWNWTTLERIAVDEAVKIARILKSVKDIDVDIKGEILYNDDLRKAILRSPEEFKALSTECQVLLTAKWRKISETDKNRPMKELAQICLTYAYDNLVKEDGINESALHTFAKFDSAANFFQNLHNILQRNESVADGQLNKIFVDKVNALAKQKLKNEDLNGFKIEIEAQVEMLFETHPKTLARLKSLNLDYASFKRILDGAVKLPQSSPAIIDLAIAKNWLSEGEAGANRFHSLMKTVERAQLNEHQVQNLMSLSPSKSMLDSIASLATHDKRAALYLQTKLNHIARLRDIDPDIIADKHFQLRNFTEEETAQLQKMADQGLSLIQIATFAEERESNRDYVRQLLKENLTVPQFKDVLKLSLFPPEVALKLARAYWEGRIRLQEVVGELKNYKHGHAFYVLINDHVINERPIDGEAISKLREQAAQSNTAVYGPNRRHTEKDSRKPADTFVQAADSIIREIPPEQPVVLLGRDAWPLVPILRERGRNAMYFLFSRLQLDDENTNKQWLREIPPGAAVIDSGYTGTIIKAIEKFDPSVSGYLMSATHSPYPRLLKSNLHSQKVSELEILPKLIYRTHRHNEDGNAISRRKALNNDGDVQHYPGAKFRFRAESTARSILRGADMPEWTTWRYSTFVGLTPKERLGLSSSEEVQKHYESVLQARTAATAATAAANLNG
ncbi:MAG: hypothetical protein K2Y39_14070 [Candidatus Obscuribacterales bacterium]|nr:hypothetical protein [Candidatus Obscuribacterales bacterium]